MTLHAIQMSQLICACLQARQYAWRTAAKRLGDAEQPAAGLPAAVLEVRALLPNIREERPAVKDAWYILLLPCWTLVEGTLR